MLNRRRFLLVLLTSPLFQYIRSPSHPKYPHTLSLQDPGLFIIINGWVLLKQDLIEHTN